LCEWKSGKENILSLAEVQVLHGENKRGPCRGGDESSTRMKAMRAWRLMATSMATMKKQKSTTHTEKSENPWWNWI